MATRWMKGMLVGGFVMALLMPPAEAWWDPLRGPLQKLTRGAANALTGWLEVPSQILWTTEVEGSAAGVSVGAARGLGLGIKRTVVGVFEAATFLLPNYSTRGGGDSYGPLIQPEFVILRPADKS